MKINWYGHAAFRVVTGKGTGIIIDPYEAGAYDGALGYGKITDAADIVITSHDHADHNYTKDIQGKYDLINQAGVYEIKDVKIETIPTYHDESGGKERGHNLISVIQTDGMILVHLGDLGHRIEPDILKKIGKVDILLIPVGGFFTIDSGTAAEVMDGIKPLITIPMHFKTEKCGFPIASVEDFTKGRPNVRVLKDSAISVSRESLPQAAEIVVLAHAL
jgi:L-ascorbate metabolism protein UlaG (beta-lactamase superfamily)